MLNTLFSPSGRLQRKRYLKTILFISIGWPVLSLAVYYATVISLYFLGHAELGVQLGLLGLLICTLSYFFSVCAVSAKRLRDCALSPYIALAAMIPLLTLPLIIFLSVYPTDFAKSSIKL